MRRHHRRRSFCIAAAPVVGVAATECFSRGQIPGTTEVTVAIVSSTLFAPLYVAQARGYFATEHIILNLRRVKAGQNAVGPMVSGKLDVVAAGFSAGLFSAIASGLDLKVVGSMGIAPGDSESSPSALEVSTKLGDVVTDPADLGGRRVAVAGGLGAAGCFHLSTMLEPAGLILDDVQVVNLDIQDMQAALANGRVDAALAAAPFTTKMEHDGVAKPLVVPPKNSSATGLIYAGSFARGTVAQRFFNALVRASHDLQGHGAKSEQVLTTLAQKTGQDIAILRATPSYLWLPDLAPLSDQLEKQQKVYEAAGLMKYAKPHSATAFVDATFAQESARK